MGLLMSVFSIVNHNAVVVMNPVMPVKMGIRRAQSGFPIKQGMTGCNESASINRLQDGMLSTELAFYRAIQLMFCDEKSKHGIPRQL